MPVYAGIDEAGYGPTLGPLVVSLTAFRAGPPAEGTDAHDLWARIGEEAILRAPPKAPRGAKARAPSDDRLVVCDSKKLYSAGGGLRRMEDSVLSFLGLATGAPVAAGFPDGFTFPALLSHCGLPPESLAPYPWYAAALDFPLPKHSFKTVVKKRMSALRRALERAEVEPLLVLPCAVHPAEFNDGVRLAGNKHLFEWGIVARFLRLLFDRFGEEGVSVLCDRLSGRDFYGPPLADLFPDARVTGLEEGDRRSAYRVRRGKRDMRVAFVVDGDGLSFPTALASCTSKYVRELFMEPLNRFFAERVPGLRATAGYHGDARRFLEEVREEWRKLALPDDLLIRIC